MCSTPRHMSTELVLGMLEPLTVARYVQLYIIRRYLSHTSHTICIYSQGVKCEWLKQIFTDNRKANTMSSSESAAEMVPLLQTL